MLEEFNKLHARQELSLLRRIKLATETGLLSATRRVRCHEDHIELGEVDFSRVPTGIEVRVSADSAITTSDCWTNSCEKSGLGRSITRLCCCLASFITIGAVEGERRLKSTPCWRRSRHK